MAGLLTPPELAGVVGVAVSDARALAIIAASALAFWVGFATEPIPVPTAAGEPDGGEADSGCVTPAANPTRPSHFCYFGRDFFFVQWKKNKNRIGIFLDMIRYAVDVVISV